MTILHGKIAIVTGATREQGIGAAICRQLAEAGADIFFTHFRHYDRQQEYYVEDNFPQRLHDELTEMGVRVGSMELNLKDVHAVSTLLGEVQRQLGVPNILVNNATHCESVDFENLSANILDDHYAVNVRGTFMLTVEFAKLIKENGYGRIVNLVSGQDKSPQPHNLPYVATKGAVSAFTTSLAPDLAKYQITVNAVDPGPTDTGWMTEEIKDYVQQRFPMGRVGVPKDAARLITFLASEEAQWITGQIIHSDGGYLN